MYSVSNKFFQLGLALSMTIQGPLAGAVNANDYTYQPINNISYGPNSVAGTYNDYDVPTYQMAYHAAVERLRLAEQRYDNIEADLIIIESDLNQKIKELDATRSSIAANRKKISNTDAASAALAEKIKRWKNALNDIIPQAKEAKTALDKAKAEAITTNEAYSKTSSKIEALKIKADKKQAILDSLLDPKSKVGAAKIAADAAAKAVADTEGSIATEKDEITKLNASQEKFEKELAGIQPKLDASIAKQTELKATADKLRTAAQNAAPAEKEEARKKAMQARGKAKEATDEVTGILARKATLPELIIGKTTAAKNTETAIAALKATLKAQKEASAKAEDVLASLRDDAQNNRAEIPKAQEEAAAAKNALADAKLNSVNLKEDKNAADRKLEQKQKAFNDVCSTSSRGVADEDRFRFDARNYGGHAAEAYATARDDSAEPPKRGGRNSDRHGGDKKERDRTKETAKTRGDNGDKCEDDDEHHSANHEGHVHGVEIPGDDNLGCEKFTALRKAIKDGDAQIIANNKEVQKLITRNQNVLRPLAWRQREIVERKAHRANHTEETLFAAGDDVRDTLAAADAAWFELNRVQSNYAQGIAEAARQGSQDGAPAGATAGSDLGFANGQADGQTNGERDGMVAGDKTAGRINGEALGELQALAQAKIDAENDGPRDGKRDGKILAYTAEAKKDGHLDYGKIKNLYVANQISIERANARMKATTDPEGAPEGKAEADSEFYNATLSEVVPNSSSTFSGNWKGDINYDDTQRMFPHPDLSETYKRAYEDAFISTADSAYDNAYGLDDKQNGTYWKAYYPAAKAKDLLHENPKAQVERTQTYYNTKEAFRASQYKLVYEGSGGNNGEYERIYRPLYNAAKANHVDDKIANNSEKTYSDLYFNQRKATLEQDKHQARENAYAQVFGSRYASSAGGEYPSIRAAVKKEAYDAQVSYFENNAVLEYDGGLLIDGNDDGVFAPGEKVSVSVVIKNYGKKEPASMAHAHVSSHSQFVQISQSSAEVAKTPGQSRMLVKGIAPFTVSKDAPIGVPQDINLKLDASNGGKQLANDTFSMTVSYPYKAMVAEGKDLVTPGEINTVKVSIENVTKKAGKEVTVKMTSADGLTKIVQPSAKVGVIEPDKPATAKLAFTLDEANAYKKLNFKIEVFEGAWKLGSLNYSVSSSKGWKYNKDSKGLILASGQYGVKNGEEAAASIGVKYDLFDLQVKGSLQIKDLNLYQGKILVVPKVDGYLTKDTTASVETFINQGGTVLYGNIGGSSLSNHFGEMLADKATRSGRVLLEYKSQGTVINIWKYNSFASNDKSIIAFGQSTSGAQSMAKEMLALQNLMIEFSQKLSNLEIAARGTSESQTLWKAAVLFDIFKEIKDDINYDSKRFHKNNKTGTKLNAFVTKALQLPNGNARNLFLSLYPKIEALRQSMSKGWLDTRSGYIKSVIKDLAKAYERQ